MQTKPPYQSGIPVISKGWNKVSYLWLYGCTKHPVGKAIIATRQSIQQEIKAMEGNPDKHADIEGLRLQLALYLSCEPTIDELILRPLTPSKASLHEYILMRLKEVTLAYSKTL